MPMSQIEERLIQRIRERAEIGRAKYGTTMERTDITFLGWLKHWQEELMDAAIYAEKLRQIVDFSEQQKEEDDARG